MQTKYRFESKINKSGSCWIWKAAKNKKGYGFFGVRVKKKWSIKYAHRYSYEVFVGKIPKDILVLHRCDTPSCVNPEHLFLGTHLDNSRDKIEKGRGVSFRGENNPRSILKREDITRIKKMYDTGKYTQKVLAEMFGVKKSALGNVLTGKSWK